MTTFFMTCSAVQLLLAGGGLAVSHRHPRAFLDHKVAYYVLVGILLGLGVAAFSVFSLGSGVQSSATGRVGQLTSLLSLLVIIQLRGSRSRET